MKVYSIFDKVSRRYNAPFLAESDEVAVRSFHHGVKDSPFATDLELYCVGSFEPESYKLPFVSADSSFVCAYAQFAEVGEDNG